jgi:dolichol-phosphate mannosyltransferase
MQKSTLAILVPTYNEIENIALLLRAIAQVQFLHQNWNFHIYVLDDSSPDGTGVHVEQLAIELNKSGYKVQLLTRLKKEGLGKAYIFGFNYALNDHLVRPDFVMQMDADLSHDPKYLNNFIEAFEADAQVVLGARYIPGGSCPDWSWYRKFLSSAGNYYARMVLGSRVHDYTGGFNAYSIGLLRAIELNQLDSAGYGFQIDLKFQMLKLHPRIVEVPIQFIDRQHGQSKMPLNTVFQNFLLVLKIKFSAWFAPKNSR